MVRFIILMAFACLSITTKAQGWEELPIRITGKIIGDRPEGQDSLRVLMYPDFVLFGQQEWKIPVDQDGRFKVDLEKQGHPVSLQLFGNGPRALRSLVSLSLEPGESVYLEMKLLDGKPSVDIQSNFKRKQTCLDSLVAEKNRFNARISIHNRSLRSLINIESDYTRIHQFIADGYRDLLRVLDSFKNDLSPQTYQDYKARYAHFYLSVWEAEIATAFSRAKDDSIKKRLIKVYEQLSFPEATVNPAIATHNEYYLQHLLEKSRTVLFLDNQGSGYSYSTIYQYLKDHYTGALRDRLLSYFLLDVKSAENVNGYSAEEFDRCFSDALGLIREPFLIGELTNRIIFRKGTPVFPFSMPDTAGNIVGLQDQKGKVVLLDIWGEGCSGCAIFARMVKTYIWPQLKDRKDFVVLSISVDRSRERWLKGIYSGKYTDPQHINLYTDGKALEHPFTKHYFVNALPFMLLIDKIGNLAGKIELSLKREELLKLIHAALEQE